MPIIKVEIDDIGKRGLPTRNDFAVEMKSMEIGDAFKVESESKDTIRAVMAAFHLATDKRFKTKADGDMVLVYRAMDRGIGSFDV